MSSRFEALAPTNDQETNKPKTSKKQQQQERSPPKKRENIFKSKSKNTRFNFSNDFFRDKSDNRDPSDKREKSQSYDKNKNSERNSFRNKKRHFRESFFERKKYSREFTDKKDPEPPKNFTFKDDDFPTL